MVTIDIGQCSSLLRKERRLLSRICRCVELEIELQKDAARTSPSLWMRAADMMFQVAVALLVLVVLATSFFVAFVIASVTGLNYYIAIFVAVFLVCVCGFLVEMTVRTIMSDKTMRESERRGNFRHFKTRAFEWGFWYDETSKCWRRRSPSS